MKRIERLGSATFVTVLISFVFHIIAMSYDDWKTNTCVTCGPNDPIGSWKTALITRCYITAMGNIFSIGNYSKVDSFRSELCVTSKFLTAKDLQHASYCLEMSLNDADTLCSTGTYNTSYCECDYAVRTQVTLSMTILTAISLGVLIFISHLVSFVKKDYILKWIIPICYLDLTFAILSMLVTLFTAGTGLYEDVNEVRYSWSLFDVVYYNESEASVNARRQQEVAAVNVKYSVTLGWCFGMELLAFYFAVVSLVLYLIIYLEKKRPGSIKIIQ